MSNETITLNVNRDGLEIDFSRITYGDVPNNPKTAPSWGTFNFSASDLAKAVEGAKVDGGSVTFTEDQLEVYLKGWLDSHFKHTVTSFRWMWDRYMVSKSRIEIGG